MNETCGQIKRRLRNVCICCFVFVSYYEDAHLLREYKPFETERGGVMYYDAEI